MIRNRKIGFLPGGSYMQMPLIEVCKNLKSIGYDCIEIPVQMLCPRKNNMAKLKEVVQSVLDTGLEISEVVVQQDLVLPDEEKRRDTIQYVNECMEAYSQLGVNIINLFTGPVPWCETPFEIDKHISAGAAWDMVFEAFFSFAQIAEKYKVNIAVENVWGMLCNGFFTARHLITTVNSSFVGVNYDPSHDILAGNFDIGWIVRQWGDKIKHVHIKDAVGIGKMGLFAFPLIGEGRVNWKEFFRALNDICYKGTCSVEFESFDYLSKILDGDMSKAAHICMDALQKLI